MDSNGRLLDRAEARFSGTGDRPVLLIGFESARHPVDAALAQALEHPETRAEASEALRGLIDAIVLTPNQGELQIELKGNLAAMLGAAQNAKRSPETGDLSLQVVLVAGAQPALSAALAPRSLKSHSVQLAPSPTPASLPTHTAAQQATRLCSPNKRFLQLSNPA